MGLLRKTVWVRVAGGLLALAMLPCGAWAGAPALVGAERVTLSNGFAFDCVRREPVGERVRLYLVPTEVGAEESFLEVAAEAVVSVEAIPFVAPILKRGPAVKAEVVSEPSATELRQMVSAAGTEHHIDAELLLSLVHAESAGHAHAVSRTGARGLMQLMPGTAASLGVSDSFVASENVRGGTKYFDGLLTRYHDNIALALAAYNAGPAAVDRYHGVPPFRETRAYVARVIREFNRRKVEAVRANSKTSEVALLTRVP